MTHPQGALSARFRDSLSRFGTGKRVLVAVSGGLDSTVLLHLSRFAARDSGNEWIAAHVDHRMRVSSAADARWVSGLCRAWDVPLVVGRADTSLTSEEEARASRYDFLASQVRRNAADLLVTGHHGDDQAETVLFRLLRGTGSKGLGGIPAFRPPGIGRPLLDFWRAELLEYAQAVRLTWRDDPTNRNSAYARNALRNGILPDIERLVAPGARRALVRLADAANEEEAAWESMMPGLLRPLDVREVESGVSVARAALIALHPAVRARVIRALSARVGVSLDRTGTRLAVEFTDSGSSGRAIQLGAALSVGLELDRCVLGRTMPIAEERALAIQDPGPGSGTVVLAGSPIPVAWGGADWERRQASEAFELAALRFPLTVRSRRPGDRIRLPGGTKKVKKFMLERRIPPSERRCVPLVVDAEGRVLWIPGLARAESVGLGEAQNRLRIGIG
ncbi:MAG: tRNA lysidine(34) synthetase TilS [Gemmatimonadota bacterium]|nr:tRNA lysidine(34) synthetase TilS [Gemmatimonadota bacterium]